MARTTLPDFITASSSPDKTGEVRLAGSVAEMIHVDPTHGHLGIAHALAKAGYMLSDEYHRFFGDGEYGDPTP
jgi:hypothetical protein